ncbi:unnamed protein product, partial [Amoebophrya sp. A25]
EENDLPPPERRRPPPPPHSNGDNEDTAASKHQDEPEDKACCPSEWPSGREDEACCSSGQDQELEQEGVQHVKTQNPLNMLQSSYTSRTAMKVAVSKASVYKITGDVDTPSSRTDQKTSAAAPDQGETPIIEDTANNEQHDDDDDDDDDDQQEDDIDMNKDEEQTSSAIERQPFTLLNIQEVEQSKMNKQASTTSCSAASTSRDVGCTITTSTRSLGVVNTSDPNPSEQQLTLAQLRLASWLLQRYGTAELASEAGFMSLSFLLNEIGDGIIP